VSEMFGVSRSVKRLNALRHILSEKDERVMLPQKKRMRMKRWRRQYWLRNLTRSLRPGNVSYRITLGTPNRITQTSMLNTRASHRPSESATALSNARTWRRI
jgi:hypothetical protein